MRAKCNDDLSTVNFSTIGLDVHKNRLVACAVHVQHDAKGREVHEKEYFESTGTYSGRQRLTEWCSSQNADLILMESTGIFWLYRGFDGKARLTMPRFFMPWSLGWVMGSEGLSRRA